MSCPKFDFTVPKNEVWDVQGEIFCGVAEGHPDYPVTVKLTCKDALKLHSKYRGPKPTMIDLPCELDPCSFEGQLVAAVQANGGTTDGMGLNEFQATQVEQLFEACSAQLASGIGDK